MINSNCAPLRRHHLEPRCLLHRQSSPLLGVSGPLSSSDPSPADKMRFVQELNTLVPLSFPYFLLTFEKLQLHPHSLH